MPSPEVKNVLKRLHKVRKAGEGWAAACPCRADDHNPSISVGEGADGRALIHCHRGDGCDTEDICRALGVEVTDLFPPKDEKLPMRKESRGPGTLEDTYDYVDEHGFLVFQVLRYRDGDGKKTFRQRQPDGDGWSWSTSGLDKPLYRLPEVREAATSGQVVFVVEGEKDVHAVEDAGYVATTNPGGAGGPNQQKWTAAHSDSLIGARVIIVADNDEPGLRHAHAVEAELLERSIPVKLRVPPAPYKDVADLLAAGGSMSDLVPVDTELALETVDEFQVVLDALAELADRDLDYEAKLARARGLLDAAAPQGQLNPGRLVKWSALIGETDDDSYDWLIPGMLERGERVMIVAAEGVGKTMLARQVAILSGAGVHPFTFGRMRPVRTLFVDLENPERIIRRTSRKILANVRANYDKNLDPEAHLWIKPDGINVLKPADRALLEAQIEATEPELLVLGPLYKSFIDPGNKTAEATAIEVAKYLDELRTRYGCALWLEHHAPLGNGLSGRDLRPMGSAVWMRWPEFGYALAPDPVAVGTTPEYLVQQWRGPRDLRQWPTRMRRSELFPFEVLEFHGQH
jgi:5S rRNA maturation endonuclease (ribonuclease M5)